MHSKLTNSATKRMVSVVKTKVSLLCCWANVLTIVSKDCTILQGWSKEEDDDRRNDFILATGVEIG